ncbi:hypothetical protein SKAU_G00393830 [Synaphobranchus kaupii]|uniref:PID domain-containing protein n=1 Tax=Synaphobranchus kaupii TaxID=118154 RepID=A0A9Q1EC16_SYNKA|nr:hypothetical protein SKAU_G00393830 [Synaphobranchus kaupii]
MEGLFFEVKPRNKPDQSHNGGRSPTHTPLVKVQDRPQEVDEEFQYILHLVGSLPVHPLTTMAMLPWVVAEIRRPGEREKPGRRASLPAKPVATGPRNEPVRLQVSASAVRCILDAGPGRPWDPLHHTLLFEHRPHRVHKLIHNSQEPSYFGCLVREESTCACYVFRCEDHFKATGSQKVLGRVAQRSHATALACRGASCDGRRLTRPPHRKTERETSLRLVSAVIVWLASLSAYEVMFRTGVWSLSKAVRYEGLPVVSCHAVSDRGNGAVITAAGLRFVVSKTAPVCSQVRSSQCPVSSPEWERCGTG